MSKLKGKSCREGNYVGYIKKTGQGETFVRGETLTEGNSAEKETLGEA